MHKQECTVKWWNGMGMMRQDFIYFCVMLIVFCLMFCFCVLVFYLCICTGSVIAFLLLSQHVSTQGLNWNYCCCYYYYYYYKNLSCLHAQAERTKVPVEVKLHAFLTQAVNWTGQLIYCRFTRGEIFTITLGGRLGWCQSRSECDSLIA